MRRAGEREGPTLDLEILDPLTGESLDGDAVPLDRQAPHEPRRRVTRLRWLVLVLVVLSATSAGGAAYRVVVMTSLQRIDRSWAEAMAVDRARQAADRRVVDAAVVTGTGARDPARREALRRIGDEAAAALRSVEEDLRQRWLPDDRVGAVRDDMLEALRFRRFQLSPDRGRLGSTPLERVDQALEAELQRFGLERSVAPPPVLASAEAAVEELRRFATVETGTVLVASRGRRLLHVDVDASTVDDRTLLRPPERLVAVGDLVVVADGATVTAYPVRPDRPARWSVAGSSVVAARPGTSAAVWVTTAEHLRAVGADGATVSLVPRATGAELLADTDGGLLLRTHGRLRLHDADTGAVVRDLDTIGRFAGASARFVAVQPPGRPALAIHRLHDASVFVLDLPRTDAGQVVASPTADELAFAAGPLAGNIASVLRLELRGPSWSLVGVGGPRGVVEEGALVWAPSGSLLFWLTPEGRIAYATGTDAALLRSTLDGLDRIVAFPRRR